MSMFVVVGKWSDRVGRKKPILIGNVLTLILLFPAFWGIGALANPGLNQAAATAPVTVSGPQCTYDPFADEQATECGRLLQDLTTSGVAYSLEESPVLQLRARDEALSLDGYAWGDAKARQAQLQESLARVGYDFSAQFPPILNLVGIIAILLVLGGLSALTYGSVAALLTEMFPPKIRYSSMSIPYHLGAGYFGGFLPLIAAYIIAKTGDAYSGLWYTWVMTLIAMAVAWWGLPDGPPKDFEDA